MARGKSTFIYLVCAEGEGKGRSTYATITNKKTTGKLERRKYCPVSRKHVKHVSKDIK